MCLKGETRRQVGPKLPGAPSLSVSMFCSDAALVVRSGALHRDTLPTTPKIGPGHAWWLFLVYSQGLVKDVLFILLLFLMFMQTTKSNWLMFIKSFFSFLSAWGVSPKSTTAFSYPASTVHVYPPKLLGFPLMSLTNRTKTNHQRKEQNRVASDWGLLFLDWTLFGRLFYCSGTQQVGTCCWPIRSDSAHTRGGPALVLLGWFFIDFNFLDPPHEILLGDLQHPSPGWTIWF